MKNSKDIHSLYGNKTAGLDLAKNLGLSVPPYYPLAHDYLVDIFKKSSLDLEKEWQAIVDNCPQGANIAEYIFEESKPGGKIYELRTRITKCKLKIKFLLETSHYTYENKSIKSFLTDNLMVRSSGDEDKATSANPGGNDSYPSLPNTNDLAEKICWVVSSYFGEKSFGQRKSSDEDITKFPQLSVLLHLLVSEKAQKLDEVSLEKPSCVSGVTFSSQADGASSLMVTNCTYGHGKGVVESLVPIDTYIVANDKVIDKVIAIKDARIAPVISGTSIELKEVFVDEQQAVWVNKACLSQEQIQELSEICKRLEKEANGEPLDIEWVHKNGRFEIVQVRKLSSTKAVNIKPSYVKVSVEASVAAKLTTIVPAYNVRQIETIEQLIVAPTLAIALKIYSAHQDKDSIKAIIVSNGVKTSHEANYFRSKNLPIFASQDLDKVKRLAQSNSLMLCCQTGRILTSSTPLTIVDGLYAHPYKSPLAVEYSSQKKQEISENLAKFAKTNKAAMELPLATLSQLMRTISQLLNSLRETEHLDALYKLMELATTVAVSLSNKNLDRTLSFELNSVFQQVINAARAIQDVVNDPAIPAKEKHIQKLYALNRLEAMLFQEYDPSYVKTYSLAQILKVVQAVSHNVVGLESILSQLEPHIAELLVQAISVSLLCMNSEFKQGFKDFIQTLALKHPDDFVKFCIMVKNYQMFGSKNTATNFADNSFLQLAINLMPDLKKYSAKECFDKMWQEYQGVVGSDIFSELKEIKMRNHTWMLRNEQWEEPEKFDSLWKDFQNSFLVDFERLIKLLEINKDNKLISQLIINEIKTAIDIYDSSLKSQSGSSKYPSKPAQVENFQTMLGNYCEISAAIIKGLPPSIKDAFYIKYEDNTLDKLIDALTKHVKDTFALFEKHGFAAKFLDPHPDFDVSAAVFTNSVGFHKHTKYNDSIGWFASLADIFTLMHQNALNALALRQQGFLDKSRLPSKIQHLIDNLIFKLKYWGDETPDPKLIEWSFDYPQLSLKYGFSLRQHGATIVLKCDINNPADIALTLDMIMDNEQRRWMRSRSYACLADTKLNNEGARFQSCSPLGTIKDYFISNKFYYKINTTELDEETLDSFRSNLENLFALTSRSYLDGEADFDENSHNPALFKY